MLNIISSSYIFKLIMKNIIDNRYMTIIKYNKRLQKKLNKNINDYKEYSETKTPIIIYIQPEIFEAGKFINIEEKDKKYYHIYFNQNEKEENRTEIKKREMVGGIKIIIDHQIKTFKNLFKNCEIIKSFKFIKCYRADIIDMSFMFCRCSKLENVDFSEYKMKNVENLSFMFYDCKSLKFFYLDKYDLNIKNMNSMFAYSGIGEIIFSFTNKNEIDMSEMFFYCIKLVRIDIRKKISTNNTKSMFDSCFSLIQVFIDDLDIKNVIDVRHMFNKCLSLKYLDLSKLNGENIQKYEGFTNCTPLLNNIIYPKNFKYKLPN